MKRFILRLLLFSFFAFFISFSLGQYLSQKRNLIGYYPTIRWNEFYNQPDNSIDLLFLGSSHIYVSMVPALFDSILNCNSFNMGSSSQSLLSSYFVLKEVLKKHSPKSIVLEVNHTSFYEYNEFINASHNFDNMKLSYNSFEYILSTCSAKEMFEVIFPLYRFNNYKSLLFSSKSNVNNSTMLTGNQCASREYVSKGFVKADRVNDYNHIALPNTIKPFNISRINQLKEIINLCNNNGIELFLFTQCWHPAFLKSITNYESYTELMSKISNEYKLKYIDLNTVSELIPISYLDFYDKEHLLYSGAKKSSSFMANYIIQNSISNL